MAELPEEDLPYYEAIHLADWIYQRAEELAEEGHPKPILAAEYELYEMTLDEEERKKTDFYKWRANEKKKRLKVRRDLEWMRAVAELRSELGTTALLQFAKAEREALIRAKIAAMGERKGAVKIRP